MIGLEGIAIMIFLVVIVISLIMSVGIYLLNSFGIMGFLKGLGDSTPALAFVPYLNTYYLGRIGSKEPSKVSALGITLVCLQVAVSLICGIGSTFINIIDIEEEFLIIPVIFMMLLSLAYMVVFYIAYSRIFIKYSKNGVLFTVLNILLGGGILGSIFLFVLRNNKPLDEQNM